MHARYPLLDSAGGPRAWQDAYVSSIRNTLKYRFNVIVAKNAELINFRERQQGTIDIWWMADDGGLVLLVAHLLSQCVHPLMCSCVWLCVAVRLYAWTLPCANMVLRCRRPQWSNCKLRALVVSSPRKLAAKVVRTQVCDCTWSVRWKFPLAGSLCVQPCNSNHSALTPV